MRMPKQSIWLFVVVFAVVASVAEGSVSEIDVELRVLDAAYGSDHMSDAIFAPYLSITEFGGNTCAAEVWMRDVGTITSGVTGGFVDIDYTTAFADATTIYHGTIYMVLAGGSINDPAGLVDNLGGATMNSGEGASDWVRLGYVQFGGVGASPVTFTLTAGAAQFSQVGAGNVDWPLVNFTGTPHTVLPEPGVLCLFLAGSILSLVRRKRRR